MNSKFSNQDLINATFEIYEQFNKQNINKKIKNKLTKPLLLSKEVKLTKKTIKHSKKNNLLRNGKISNQTRLKKYKKKREQIKNLTTLKLNKIIKFESQNYLLLHKIKNSDLKIIRMKRPNL